MSILKKIEEITCYIEQKYPTMEYGNINVSNEEIGDICKVVLNKAECKKVRTNLVKSLNNANSALRHLLDKVKDKNELNSIVNFRKRLEDNGYSKNDFLVYNPAVINSVCKFLKIKNSHKNKCRLFNKCCQSFKENKANISKYEQHSSKVQNNSLNDNTVKYVKNSFVNNYFEKQKDSNLITNLHLNTTSVEEIECNEPKECHFELCDLENYVSLELDDHFSPQNFNIVLQEDQTESTRESVRKILFTPEKGSNKYDMKQRSLDEIENEEINFMRTNQDFFNSFFETYEDECCESEDNSCSQITPKQKLNISVAEEELFITEKKLKLVQEDYNVNTISEESCSYNLNQTKTVAYDNTECKVDICMNNDEFTPEKRFQSIEICSTPEADLKALPKGSKNVYPLNLRASSNSDKLNKMCFKKCTYVEGVIGMLDKEVKTIIESTKQINLELTDKINELLRQKFALVNNSCVLTIKNKNVIKKGLACYGICRHETCKQFKLNIVNKTTEQDAKMTVLSNNINYSHSGKLTTFLKGNERERLRQMSKYCPPMSLRQKFILKASPSRLKRGNLGDIRSDRVFYKVSHEYKSRDDLSSKDRDDMYLLKETCSEFVQHVSHPMQTEFETYLFSKEQIDVLKKLKTFTMHVDATGTVVRETTKDSSLFQTGKRKEKRLLYYAAVILCNNRIIPVAEYLTTKQTATAISNWLIEFRTFYENISGEQFRAHVVSDFSGAILKAFVKAFNGFNQVAEYLNKCYDYMYEEQPFDCNVLISLCSCHLIKNISDDAHKYYKKDNLTKRSLACLVTACVSPAFNITSAETLDRWFCSITTVLLSQYRTQDVNKALEVLKILSSDSTSNLVDDRYIDSKYLTRFQNIAAEVKEKLTTATLETEKNQFYSVEFHNNLMGSIIPVIPMWTGVMRFNVLQSTERASNAPAESWFGDLLIIVHFAQHRKK